MDAERQNGTNGTKRKDYLEWNQYFMAVAFLSAQRSKDPRTQVGACIVNQENKIVGAGYNGMPIGCPDDVMPWGREDPDSLNNKYLYVCHAELNAVVNKMTADVKGCTIYVTLFPCNECAKVIIQSGIKEVIYFSDKNSSKVEFQASRRLLDTAGIPYRKFERCPKQIVIDLSQDLPPQDLPPQDLPPKEQSLQEQPSQQSSGDLPSQQPPQEQPCQQDSHDLPSQEQLLEELLSQELTLQQSS